ncbi:MAG: 50S ribosomal protein L10 [Saprospiraceae bacterium]|nr:50S ribosomal protein L10 [Saprospiraceae bacterium]MBP7699603.1 50S ribosomal protein L10 [Saprospiraceae bacterium]
MDKAQKTATIAELKEKFDQSQYFYIADASTLSVEKINKLRRLCFERGIEIRVLKNTLVKKAMESLPEEKGFTPLYDALHYPSAFLFTDTANLPAKLIKEFRGKDGERPLLKAAYIDSAVFLGNDQLDTLANLKSREELIGEIIGLLQSPAKNVVSALKSGGATIAGLVKALEERA